MLSYFASNERNAHFKRPVNNWSFFTCVDERLFPRRLILVATRTIVVVVYASEGCLSSFFFIS